jgi:hypothetical protein
VKSRTGLATSALSPGRCLNERTDRPANSALHPTGAWGIVSAGGWARTLGAMKAREAMHSGGNGTNRLTCYFVTAFAGAWLAWLPIVLGTDGLAVLPVRVPVALAFVMW